MYDENLTPERLRMLVRYDPNDGTFTKLRATGGGRAVGEVMGTKTKQGYIKVSLDGVAYRANRLAWYWTYGKWPEHPIDHINGDRTDNRISNLREVTTTYNAQNALRKPRAGALPTGVRRVAKGRFSAQIMAFGMTRRLGVFDSAEEAGLAYLEGKRRLHHGWCPQDTPEFEDCEV